MKQTLKNATDAIKKADELLVKLGEKIETQFR